MVNHWRVFILFLLLLGLWTGTAAALTVQAVTGQDRVALGESLQLQLQLDGSPDAEPDFTSLQQDWEILSRSQSSEMQIINSNFTRSVVYSLSLMPRTAGTMIIPAICFDQDCSLPISIEVSPPSAQAAASTEQILLETEISSQKIVTQGQLLLKVRLWIGVDLLEGQLPDPQPTGVVAQVKKLTDVRDYKERKGKRYQVIERDYAIFPQGVGQMQIPALQFDGAIAAGRSRLDPFARQGTRQHVRRLSQPLQVEVLPLPSDLGQRPWIPATSILLQDDWQQQQPQLVVGEPATRTLRLSAAGVQAAQLPALVPGVPEGFKTYPDQPSREDQIVNSGIMGVMEQKIALIPTRAGRYRLPAVELDWWDLSRGQWRKAKLAALEIQVTPATGAGAQILPSAPASQQDKPPATVLGSISPTVISAPVISSGGAGAAANSGIWPWVSLVLALGWLLSLLLFNRRRRTTAIKKAATVADEQLNEKGARKAVSLAAQNNDPQATRQALLTLSLTLWPRVQSGAYEQLFNAADPALQSELAKLDSCLYGRSSAVWDGQGLVAALAAWRSARERNTGSELPGLYPDRSA